MTERSEDALKAVFVSITCGGERCRCGRPAVRKVGEQIPGDDPMPRRHNLTAYVCAQHYAELMGPLGAEHVGYTRSEASPPVIDEGVVERVAAAIHAARFPEGREPTPFEDEDASGTKYCRRLARAALEAGCAGLVAENERYRTMLDTLSRRAALVMQMLEDDGPQVVPHLIDTDDNPGQYLRVAIDTARAALRGDREQEEG